MDGCGPGQPGERVTQRDMTDAWRRCSSAPPGTWSPPEERRRTAHHEAGHARSGEPQAGADLVRKMSIIPQGHAQRVTLSIPEQDRNRLRRELSARPDHRCVGWHGRRGPHGHGGEPSRAGIDPAGHRSPPSTRPCRLQGDVSLTPIPALMMLSGDQRVSEVVRSSWPSFGLFRVAEDRCSAMTINAKAQAPGDGASAERVAGPPSERLAARIAARQARPPSLLDDLTRLDLAMYRAIAETPTPTLDEPVRRLSNVADHSKLWLMVAGMIAALGGSSGRRTALTALGAVAVNSVVVNVPLKMLGRRARPDRVAVRVSPARHVPMPVSSSFPSGHAASAFAFVAAVAPTMPRLAGYLRALAYVVGYSRVHTGVHYPGDVIVGSLIGTAIGESVAYAARRRRSGGQ
jgi:membrane-associated phospholipid phosphatase